MDAADLAFDRLVKSLLLERMTGMPRWQLTPAPTAAPLPKAPKRQALILAPPLPGLDEPAAPSMSRAELAALETEHLLGTDTPESIAHRLGYKGTESLERTLIRANRYDLATEIRRRRAS